jgi:microcystin degradation protein MlrC
MAAVTLPRGRPLVLADTQDNPGAGGNADTTTLLQALLARGAQRVLAGVICDPDRRRAHAAGLGSCGTAVRGKLDLGELIARRCKVEALGDGRFIGTGPFYRGDGSNSPDGSAASRRHADRRGEPQTAGGGPGDVQASASNR